MGKDVIIACDFGSKQDTLEFLDKFTDVKPFVKIGMELYFAEGPDIVREIKARGHKIFLDLKMHDIPNTVKKAMRSIASLGVDMTNVHAGGGIAMMQAAMEGLDGRAILIAVTQLTSTNADTLKNELLIDKSMNETIMQYAINTSKAGLGGVVCSPLESEMIHSYFAENNIPFITVTPGIRFADSSKDDQSRITTPEKAKEMGSDYIVVGRPITQADDPVAAYKRCVAEFID